MFRKPAKASKSAQYDMYFKLLMVGDSYVGKTCMLLRYANNTYSNIYMSTIGADFKTKNVDIDGTRVKLQIWDTAGQERYWSMADTFLRGAEGIAVVYDTTDRRSFESIRKGWMPTVQKHADSKANKILVGNKCDMIDEKVVSTEEGQDLAKEFGMKFVECSAKDNINIEQAFMGLGRAVKERCQTGSVLPKTADELAEEQKKTRASSKRLHFCWNKNTKQYVTHVVNNHPSRAVLVVIVPRDEKDTVEEVRKHSIKAKGSASGGEVDGKKETHDKYARYAARWHNKTIPPNGGRFEVWVRDSFVHVYILFPTERGGRYYMSESNGLNVEKHKLIVDESDFFEGLPVVRVSFCRNGTIDIDSPS